MSDDGTALPLSAEEEAQVRSHIARRIARQTGWGTVSGRMAARLLATLDAHRSQLREATRLRRNVRFLGHDLPKFKGEWVAVPAEDFDALRAALARGTALPGLPSSFPVGSVSGSPKLPHAYNVEWAWEEKEDE